MKKLRYFCQRNKNGGFTFIETILGIFIFLLISASLFGSVTFLIRHFHEYNDKLNDDRQLYLLFQVLRRELPKINPPFWLNPNRLYKTIDEGSWALCYYGGDETAEFELMQIENRIQVRTPDKTWDFDFQTLSISISYEDAVQPFISVSLSGNAAGYRFLLHSGNL